MKRISYILAIAVALLSGASAACAAPALTRLPSEFRGTDVFLRVDAAGGKSFWMRLDIDGAKTSLSPQAAAALGLRRTSDLSLQIGPVGFTDIAFRTVPDAPCTGPDGNPVAGVLGEDALGDRPLWIDTIHKQVWISPPV